MNTWASSPFSLHSMETVMKLKKLSAACTLAFAAMFGASPAHAQFSGDVIRIGFITDKIGRAHV